MPTTTLTSVIALLVSIAAVLTTREKLRQDCFDKRFSVYKAFRDLIVATSRWRETSTIDEIKPLFDKCDSAHAEALFLFGPEISPLLAELIETAADFYNARGTQPELQRAFLNKLLPLKIAFDPYLSANKRLITKTAAKQLVKRVFQ